MSTWRHVHRYMMSYLFPVQWKRSINLMSQMKSSGAAMLTNRCLTHTYVIYRSLMHGFSSRNWCTRSISGHQPVINTLAPCSDPPHSP